MMKAIIIDDEPLAIDVLKSTIQRTDTSVEVIGKANSIEDGIRLLSQADVDVVFLDIQLKEGTGFEILEALDEINFNVIFTTAFDKYALDAFKVNAIDYLLKPVTETDLKRALKKVQDRNQVDNKSILSKLSSLMAKNNKPANIILKERGKMTVIKIDEILYFKAEGAYTCIHMKNVHKYTSSHNLGHYENELKDTFFIRSHRSYYVNMSKVVEFLTSDGQARMSNGDLVAVSDSLKETFIQRLKADKP